MSGSFFSVGSAGELPVNIRSFRPSDLEACARLYKEGLLGGKLAENDTGLDIDDIESAYMSAEGNHFWVAEAIAESPEAKTEVVGMIGVQHHDQDAGAEGAEEVREL